MNDRTPFDDLARRKLAERRPAFEQEAWADMERQLDVLRKRRGRRRALLLLLIPAAGALWFARGDARSAIAGKATPAVPHVETTAAVPEVPMRAHGQAGTLIATPDQAVPLAEAGRARPTDTHPTTKASPQQRVVRSEGARPARQTPAPPPERTPATDIQATMDAPRGATESPAPGASGTFSVQVTAVENTGISADELGPVTDVPEDPPLANDPVVQVSVPVTPQQGPTGTLIEQSDPAPAALPTDSAQQADGATDPAMDTSAVVAPVVDSALATVPVVHAAAFSVRRPWEITLWGGLFNTLTTYSGSRTEAWASDHRGLGAAGAGVELMHHGAHFGIGAGLHFSTYAERMDARELADTHTALVDHYSTQAIDTSLMVANGTVWINGQQYWATQQVDTVILVLVTTTTEETTTTVRRNALARQNRTSWLEIPLLLDAHTAMGRWSFGLRGGPTLGIVQGRRGLLPTTNGYTDLRDEAFRELVLGWTAQGYVRYRITSAWSVGFGPAARGQLLNSLNSDDLVRRSMAWGGTLGISCLLP